MKNRGYIVPEVFDAMHSAQLLAFFPLKSTLLLFCSICHVCKWFDDKNLNVMKSGGHMLQENGKWKTKINRSAFLSLSTVGSGTIYKLHSLV